MSGEFTIEVVRAVSDWQRGASHEKKVIRGEALKRAMLSLPEYFRQCDSQCFRQECHQKDRTFQVLIDDKLPETIAAWTTSLDVAKSFKGGVVWDDEERSIILAITPPAGSVIANLDRLYGSAEFQQAVLEFGPEVDYFYNGAGKYGNTQKEIVLELGSLGASNIYSYGGYSGEIDNLLSAFRELYMRDPLPEELAQIVQRTNEPWWLSEEGTRNVIDRTVPQFIDRVFRRTANAQS